MNEEPASALADVLSAYLDGELDETTACRTRKRLLSDVHARRRLEDYRQQDEWVRAALHGSLADPVPERFTRLLHSAESPLTPTPESAPRQAPRRDLVTTGLALIALGLGLAVGWGAHSWASAGGELAVDGLPDQALVTSAERGPAPANWAVSGFTEDREAFMGWLREATRQDLATPRLSHLGYDFIGGQALAGPEGASGQMLYQDAEGRHVAIHFNFSSAAAGEALIRQPGRHVEHNGVPVYAWQATHGTTYAVLGDLDAERLGTLAGSIPSPGFVDVPQRAAPAQPTRDARPAQ